MANRSKAKGNTFERAVAKALSEAYKDIFKVETSFQRNISSGSVYGGVNHTYGTQVLQENAIFAGDIICPREFLYSIECKHYADPQSINHIIEQNSVQWDKWIASIEDDCKVSGKLPMLVIKYDNIKPFTMVKEEYSGVVFKYKEYFAYKFDDFINNHKEKLIRTE